MNFSTGDAWSSRRTFLIAALMTLAFRFWLAAVTPFTGDEAYFIWWGQWPDWGFYDHPPMVGWWLALLLQISHAEWWLRLPIIIQPVVLGLAVASFLKPRYPNLAWGTATLFLLAPANVWNVFITTDTPLVYFSVLAGFAWLQARRAEDNENTAWGWYVLAGLGLAGAVLSKYFAALLGFAFLIDTLYRPSQRKLAGLVIVYALTLPGIAMMAWWNAGHCWSNVMFNFYNRHHRGNTGLSWQTPLLYLGMMMYLLTPLWFWYLQRQRHAVTAVLRSREGRALAILALVPLALFVPLSIVRTIGLHWVLSFIPFALILLALSVSAAQLRTLLRFFAGFALLHAVIIIGVANVSMEKWEKTKFYPGMVLTVESQKLLDQLQPYSDYTWMMDGYSNAVTLGVNTYVRDADGRPRYIGVFGEGSSHARHDDILTDMRAIDGGKIAILRKTAPDLATDYAPYFDHIEARTFEIRGVEFHLILGQGFNYARYRDVILARIKGLYYAVPPALPQTACYFCDRYFPGQPCQR